MPILDERSLIGQSNIDNNRSSLLLRHHSWLHHHRLTHHRLSHHHRLRHHHRLTHHRLSHHHGLRGHHHLLLGLHDWLACRRWARGSGIGSFLAATATTDNHNNDDKNESSNDTTNNSTDCGSHGRALEISVVIVGLVRWAILLSSVRSRGSTWAVERY